MRGDRVGSRYRPRRDRKAAAASVLKPRMSLELRSLLPHPNSCLGTSPHQQGRGRKKLSICGIDDVIWADRSQRSAQHADRTLAVALIHEPSQGRSRARRGGAKRQP